MPWCHNTRRLDLHHIIHRRDQGPTELWNLCALCRSCHRQHHLAQLGIEGNAEQPDGITFTDATGRTPIPQHDPDPPPDHHSNRDSPTPTPTGERLDTHWLTFPLPPSRQPTEAA